MQMPRRLAEMLIRRKKKTTMLSSIDMPYVFGHYTSQPRPYALSGQPGWWTVPAGYHWYSFTDAGLQQWVSPNPITKNPDGTPNGYPLYAAELNQDGTLVFWEELANRKLNIDSPPPTWLSQNN
jgi:hypothetical protein